MFEQGLIGADGPCVEAPQPVEVRLRLRKAQMEKSLADINAAIAALEKNPELTETLNLLRRVGI